MATQGQYDFFRLLYDQENSREGTLNQHSGRLLSLITFYSAFIIYIADRSGNLPWVTKVVLAAAIGSMLCGFLMIVWGGRVANFEALNSPDDVIGQFPEHEGMTDERFFDLRIADFSVATERNSKVNDRRADALLWASYCLATGIALHAAYFFLRIW
ncbi:hypothetical protein ACWGS9_15440 [Bradyrhizobium sp. Arg314]